MQNLVQATRMFSCSWQMGHFFHIISALQCDNTYHMKLSILWSLVLGHHVVWYLVTNVCEEHTASIFRCIPWYQITRLHSVVAKTTII